jgi:hypothetical protein
MKALYKHRKSGDIFAIETDDQGKVINTSGPLLTKDLNPQYLDYDDYWNTEIQCKIKDLICLTKDDYLEILRKSGFKIQSTQKHLFG